MNLYPYVKTRQVRRFYISNRAWILAIVFVISFIFGFVTVYTRLIQSDVEEAVTHRQDLILEQCVTREWEFVASDFCLYGHDGYEVK